MAITNATRLSDFAAGIGTEGAILKIDNANQRVGIGTQLPNQMLTVAGIVSATQYIGDGSQLEGITSAGLGTAIDETEGSAGAVVYYTDDLLTVAETTTINPPASASAAYTQYRDVKLNDSVDLIIETGDDFIPDILGLGTAINDVTAAGNGVFDEVYSDVIKNKDGLGAPTFANGFTSVGIGTFSSDVIISGNVSVGGTLTYEDVKNVDSVGLITARTGIKVQSGGIDVTAGAITASGDGINASSNLILKTGGNEKSRIDSSGRLLIGVTDTTNAHGSFDDLIVKASGGGNAGITIVTGTSNQATIAFSDGTSGTAQYNGYVQYSNNGDYLSLGAGGDDRLRIGSAGQFGVGGANYGTSGQVLTSGGGSAAPQWADAGGGAWSLLSSVSNPNTSTVDFTGLTTSYAAYKVQFINASINTNNTREMRCRIYLNGSLKTGNEYQQLTTYMSVGSNSQGGYGGTAGAILLSGAGNGARGYNGELTFPMKLRTTGAIDSMQAFYGTCISHDFHNTIGGFHNGSYSTLLTGIQFDSPDNYNVTDGQFYLYGLTRT